MSGGVLMVLGVLYAAVQCSLVWQLDLWDHIGEFLVLAIALFVFKGALVVFAGWIERAELE